MDSVPYVLSCSIALSTRAVAAAATWTPGHLLPRLGVWVLMMKHVYQKELLPGKWVCAIAALHSVDKRKRPRPPPGQLACVSRAPVPRGRHQSRVLVASKAEMQGLRTSLEAIELLEAGLQDTGHTFWRDAGAPGDVAKSMGSGAQGSTTPAKHYLRLSLTGGTLAAAMSSWQAGGGFRTRARHSFEQQCKQAGPLGSAQARTHRACAQ